MHEPSSATTGQDFDVAPLCRNFSEFSLQPMVAVEGKTHIVRYLNAAFACLIGEDAVELVGRSFAEVMVEKEGNNCLALLDRVHRTGKSEILAEQEHSHDPPVFLSYSAWPILGVENWPLGVMIQVTDVTETVIFRRQMVAINEQLLLSGIRQHELTEKAERANQNTEIAEKANQAKSEFLSRMSHELRTPLNAILGFGQILEHQQLTPLQHQSIQHILEGGRHLLGLVNEVLDISRVEAGHGELVIEPVDLTSLVAQCCDLIRPLTVEHAIQLVDRLRDYSPENRPRPLLADRQRLRQVLLNLLSNAIKYNRPGGEVMISARETADGRIQLRVEDKGFGLTPQDIQKLFIPFERLHAADSAIEGTGLGLVISQRLVHAMGGILDVESTIGQGSTFWVELPAAGPAAQVSSETAEIQLNTLGSQFEVTHTVLCIEDNALNLRLIEGMFEMRPQWALLSAVRGNVGLELAHQNKPDLILLDLNLPDINGTEVLARLQQSASTRDIPIIMLSADATPKKIEQLMNAGAKAYLTKPLNLRDFLTTLEKFLQ